MKTTLLLNVTLLAFIFSNAQTTITPSDDMTTYQTGCAIGAPNDSKLWVSNFAPPNCFNDILMKFDLSSHLGQTVTSATLKLYQNWHNPHGSPVPSKVYAINQTWDENSWTPTNFISHTSTIYATPTFTSALGWEEIDITNLVNDWLSGTITNNGLTIIANTNTKIATFHSKDHSVASEHPYLELNFATNTIEDDILKNSLSIFPNPTNNNITIRFNNNVSQNIDISINNYLGQKIKQLTAKENQSGVFEEVFSLDNLTKGLYFLKIQTNNKTHLKKFVKN